MLCKPTREAALASLDKFIPHAGKSYADLRNYDFGSGHHTHVSLLSPWLRHRVISEHEVVAAVMAQHSAKASEKFTQEVFWRSYWKGWLEMRPQVWHQYQHDLQHLYSDETVFSTCDSVLHSGSGIECFDHWRQELIDTGYLHNHARMWFASIWIFTLQLPWQLGADFFLQHLLDGDPASNTLSWRWVAGLQTKGKAYVATAENIKKFTRGRFEPIGQLNENMEALTEEFSFEKRELTDYSASVSGDSVGLIVHGDDLHPETLAEGINYKSVISVQTCNLLSPGGVSEKSAEFTRQCIDSALNRERIDPSASISFSTPETVKDNVNNIRAWAIDEKLDTVVWAYAPTGPVADVLDLAYESLRSQGIACKPIQRHWDRIVWPHAGKGFFALKKQIPQLLQALFPANPT